MDEQNQNIRPTKKQQELLVFIEAFIKENGYSPSYREIMVGCNYTSVATVALHVNSLIKRGHLVKREHNARSLEVVHSNYSLDEGGAIRTEGQWLIDKIDHYFKEYEQKGRSEIVNLDVLETLTATLQILGVEEDSQRFALRLGKLRDIEQNINS